MTDINVILAEYPGLGRVRLCECTSVHMSIGPVTINLAPEAFAQAAVLIQNAMVELKKILDLQQPELNSLEAKVPLPSRLTH